MLVKVVNVYIHLEDFIQIIEQSDFEGNDSLWYLMKYELFEILNCQIMDQYL